MPEIDDDYVDAVLELDDLPRLRQEYKARELAVAEFHARARTRHPTYSKMHVN